MKQLILLYLLFFLCSCHSTWVYEEVEELPKEIWKSAQTIEFKTEIPNSGFYRISLNLRHTTDYEYTHLWCITSVYRFPHAPLKDTLSFHIADQDGRWHGKGDNLKYLKQSVFRDSVFLHPGEVLFKIKQEMRLEQLQGVKSMGIRIEKVIEQEN